MIADIRPPSVVIPTCDRLALLANRSLPSVAAQSRRPDVVLVVDGSPWRTRRVNGEAASRGGRASARWVSGSIIGVLPGWDPDAANPYVDVAHPTGLDHGRNVVVGQANAVIAVGGGADTLSEIARAWILFRLIVARRGEGWAGRLADQRVRHPDIAEARVHGVDTAEEAVETVERWLPAYGRRRPGVRRRTVGGTS